MTKRNGGWLLVAALVTLFGGCARKSGVEVCDKFLDEYSQCMSQAGLQVNAVVKKNLADQRARFKELAKTPAGRQQLARQCTASLDAVKTSCR